MEDIQVGEWIRTKKYICKVTKIIEQDEEAPLYYCTDLSFGFLEKDIKKHSFKIIDLIEEGDFVNGREVKHIANGFIEGTMEIELYNHKKIYRNYIKEIETIITKELMKSIEYRIE